MAHPVSAQHPKLLSHSDNRQCAISISDLELAGTLAHKHILVQAADSQVAERPIWLAGDNRASLAWATQGSSTSITARAYLLRLGALHQRAHRYVPQHDYIPGKYNVMADDANRQWDLPDSDFLTHFNASYPQATSWQLLTLQDDTHSAVIGSLLQQRFIPTNLRIGTPPPLPPGACGNSSVTTRASAPTSKMSQATTSPSCSCLPSNIVPGTLLPACGRSALAQWRTPSAMWRRRSPGWVVAADPRLNAFGELDFRLKALFQSWKKKDPPPTRAKPLPLVVLRKTHSVAAAPT